MTAEGTLAVRAISAGYRRARTVHLVGTITVGADRRRSIPRATPQRRRAVKAAKRARAAA